MEAIGLRALQKLPDPETGRPTSFNRAAELVGVYPQSLSTHMKKHYQAQVEAVANDRMAELIEAYEVDLLSAAEAAPAEVKPLYLVAVQNLRGLLGTNPSQQNLIVALKTIQDITGMKAQQAILLGFARHHFSTLEKGEREAPKVLPSQRPTPAIPERADVVEAEVVSGG